MEAERYCSMMVIQGKLRERKQYNPVIARKKWKVAQFQVAYR